MALLITLLILLAISPYLAVITAHAAINLYRAWRRWQAERRPRQPYDDAYQRAVWDVAAENGYRDGLERARNPQLPSGSP